MWTNGLVAVYLSPMIEMNCIITGKVQNVAYRVYAQDSAGVLGLNGWVRNLPDGSVAVCAQGLPDTLKEFVEYLYEGSLTAKVDAVSIDWGTAKEVYEDFSIKHEYGY